MVAGVGVHLLLIYPFGVDICDLWQLLLLVYNSGWFVHFVVFPRLLLQSFQTDGVSTSWCDLSLSNNVDKCRCAVICSCVTQYEDKYG
jgi:hypothetical protein